MSMRRTSEIGPLHVYFSGIDGSGKTSCMEGLIARLSPPNRILRVGTTGVLLLADGESEHLMDSERMQALGRKVRGTPLYGFWLIGHFVYKFVAAKYFSRSADYQIAMLETDTLINPSAYLSFHFPRLCRLLSPATRFSLLHAFFGARRRTVILYLDVDPIVGVGRCRTREEDTGQVMDPHENVEDLTRVRDQLGEIIQAAQAKGYDLVTIDTSSLSVEQVIDAAETEIRNRVMDPAGSQ
jgi:thymidylate kinase